MKELWSRV